MAVAFVALGATMIVLGSHSDATRIPSNVPIINAATGAVAPHRGPAMGGGPTSESGALAEPGTAGSSADAGAWASTAASDAAPATATASAPAADPPPRSSRANIVEIPSLQVTAPIVGDCPIENGTMAPPPDVHQACRWGGSESLDVATGSGITVITGHVNYVGQGQGAFARIGDLRVGDMLVTSGPDRSTIHWSVTRVVAYVKSGGIPERVFTRPDAQRRTLRLITCGGTLQSDGNYNDNIIVTAVAA